MAKTPQSATKTYYPRNITVIVWVHVIGAFAAILVIPVFLLAHFGFTGAAVLLGLIEFVVVGAICTAKTGPQLPKLTDRWQ